MIFKFYLRLRQYVTETIRREPGKKYRLIVKNQGFTDLNRVTYLFDKS